MTTAESFRVEGLVAAAAGDAWAVASATLFAVAAAAVPRVGRLLAGTTLTAPLAWAAAVLLLLAAVEAVGGGRPPGSSPGLVRYAAAMGIFSPLVAVLGAKRPQDRVWQATVATLWVVLLLPGLHAAAARSAPQLSGPWGVFAAGLCLMTILCYGATRLRLWAALAACGQLLLISPYLSEGAAAHAAQTACGASLLFCLAAWGAAGTACRLFRGATDAPSGAAELSRRWDRFGALWGSFWAVRLATRLNQTAELQHWPVRVGLRGFVSLEADGGSPTEESLEQLTAAQRGQVAAALEALLRRFEAPAPPLADREGPAA